MALNKVLEIDCLAIKSVGSFYDGSSQVERNEFKTFVSPLINNNSSINSMFWVPRIKDQERIEFENDARSNGLYGFKIEDRSKGTLAKAALRDEYYPIFYIEPHKGNANLIGLDLASIPECLKAMHDSCDMDNMASTSHFILPGTGIQQSALHVFLPIYTHKESFPHTTIEERRHNLEGFVVGTFGISGIVEESFETLMPMGIDLYIFAGPQPRENMMLFHHTSRIHEKGRLAVDLKMAIQQSKMSFTKTLDIYGQQCTILCIPSPKYITTRMTWQPLAIGIACSMLTGLLVFYLLSIALRNEKTCKLASQLTTVNNQLKTEITERERAERNSSRENAKLSAMISAMEEGIVFADANNKIVEINNYLCKFAGMPREEIIGKSIEEIHHGVIRDRVLNHIDHFRNENVTNPFVLQRPMGGKEVIFRMQPIFRDGEYDGVLLNVIDVSKLVQARQQAEVANKAKSDFLANMSHEIRTPMAAILGYTDLLMDPKIECSNRNNYLMVVRRNSENLLHLINDILDLSKIEAGKLTINKQRCSVVSVLADVANTMRPRAELRENNLTVEYISELPEMIHTDTNRLRQAIINLVGNAVKFTENGQIRIKVTFLNQWRTDQPAIKIEVADTGIGIREEVLPQLFQPFNQGDIAATHKFGGTGLGLAISQHIVELLGGEITVKSVYHIGSTFTLIVPTGNLDGINILQHPIEIIENLSASNYTSDTNNLSGKNILVAEDSIDNQELVKIMLSKAGAKVVFAENGKVAVDKAEAGSFDLILMDMNMPEMDGYEATQLLRSRGYNRPILALTANAMSDDINRCLSVGCNEYLSKPIDRTKMMQTIAAYCGRAGEASKGKSKTAENTDPGNEEAIVSLCINDPDIASLLDNYVGRLEGQVDAMHSALKNTQFSDLQRLAHIMKGSGGNYGYPMLTAAAKDLENAAKTQDICSAGPTLNRIAALCLAIKKGYQENNTAGVSKSC
jgi:PAS domain S-box-containing protein